MEHIPILKIGKFLVVTIQTDMDDRLTLTLQDDLTNQICKKDAQGLLIDISSLDVVDSFMGRILGNITAMSRLLGAEAVIVGIRPAVAITLVELGLSLGKIRTALNLEKGIELLSASLGPPEEESSHGSPE